MIVGGTIAAGALFQYLYETQKFMGQMTSITPIFDRFMLLDSSTRRNLSWWRRCGEAAGLARCWIRLRRPWRPERCAASKGTAAHRPGGR